MKRFGTFVRDYTRGMEDEGLKRVFDRDAQRVYSVLMRDRDVAARPKRGLRRVVFDAKLLFLSISEKLTPGRRLLFAVSLIAALLALTSMKYSVNTPQWGFRIDGSPLGFTVAIAGLLFLLATELVDRVLVRDEVEVARQLQAELLPQAPPELPGWSFASSWGTANDIGGDYHRFEPLPGGRLAVVVADASGHGMAAGLLMAITDTALGIAVERDAEPDAVARVLHRAILRTNDRRSFVTLFYGLLDPATGALRFVTAGHPSPIVRRADGRLEEPAAGSLPLGLATEPKPFHGEMSLAPGDLLVVVTDGVFEAVGANGEAFGWERLRQLVARGPGSAAQLHAALRSALDQHVGAEPLSDDRTLVVIERLPDVAAAPVPPTAS